MRSLQLCRSFAAPVALALLLLACGGGDGSTPTTPASDTLTLVSITPVTSTVLRNGTTVQISARLNYTLANNSTGRISAVVLSGTSLILTDPVIPLVNLAQRTGEATLTLSFPVAAPTTRQISVTIGLFPGTSNTASVVVNASYAAGP